MNMIDLNDIITYTTKVNWGNLISVFIGAAIASIFSRNIERMKLKKDIQIKTSETITQAVSVIIDNTSKLEQEIENLSFTLCIESDFKKQILTPKDSVCHFKNITEDKNYYPSCIQQIVDVSESTNQFKIIYSDYLNSIEDLKNKLKFRKVILKNLNYLDNIILRQDTIEKIQFDFIYYYEELYKLYKEDNRNLKDFEEQFDQLENLFKLKINGLSGILECFSNELQKEFLGDLFK